MNRVNCNRLDSRELVPGAETVGPKLGRVSRVKIIGKLPINEIEMLTFENQEIGKSPLIKILKLNLLLDRITTHRGMNAAQLCLVSYALNDARSKEIIVATKLGIILLNCLMAKRATVGLLRELVLLIANKTGAYRLGL